MSRQEINVKEHVDDQMKLHRAAQLLQSLVTKFNVKYDTASISCPARVELRLSIVFHDTFFEHLTPEEMAEYERQIPVDLQEGGGESDS